MSKATLKLINRFKDVEKQHKSKKSDDIVYHQYILYGYNGDNEEMIIDNLVPCLEKIPTRFKIIEDYIYCEKCYILELNSYIIKNKNIIIIDKFKIKFGLIK